MLKYSILVIVITLLVLLFLKAVSGGSAGGTLSSGRTVLAYSDSIYITTQFSPDTATIQTAGKTIVIGPTKILIDEKEAATIKETAKLVQVTIKKGTVTILADGQPVNTN